MRVYFVAVIRFLKNPSAELLVMLKSELIK